jgi:hypothetical protein
MIIRINKNDSRIRQPVTATEVKTIIRANYPPEVQNNVCLNLTAGDRDVITKDYIYRTDDFQPYSTRIATYQSLVNKRIAARARGRNV